MKFPHSGAPLRRAVGIGLALMQAASAAAALGYEEAMALAEQQSPALQAQRSALSGAEVARSAAAALPDPRLSVGLENLPLSGMDRGSLTADGMTMRRIGLMQEVPNAAKRAARAEGAQARAERERAALVLARQQLREALARSWLALGFIAQRSAALGELVAENQRLQRTLGARIAAGTALANDVLMARQEALALADRGDELARDETRARAALRRVIGPRAAEPLQGGPRLAPLTDPQAREQLPGHAELQLYPALLNQARAELAEAQAQARGDWSWELAYSRRGAQWGDMLSVQLSFELPWQKQALQQPLIQARQREAERLAAEQEEALRRHGQALDEQLAEIAALDRQAARLHGEGLRLARERVALILSAYESGRGDLSAVLAARRELLEAQLRAIELDARRSDLRAQLAYLTAEN